MFNINDLIIDSIIKGVGFNMASGEYLFSVNQLQDATLSCTSEQNVKTDAKGTPIMSFDRAKSATLTANNALLNLGLLANQMGTEKEVASDTHKIETPCFETITVQEGVTDYTLKHMPKQDITKIFTLNGDDTEGTAYDSATAAADDKFVYASGTITVPTNSAPGTQYIVFYDYDATEAVSVTNSAKNFPKNFKFVMSVLCAEPCNTTDLILCYVIFPNAKLSSSVDISFTTDGTHPLTIEAQQAYCDKEKKLFQLVVVQDTN